MSQLLDNGTWILGREYAFRRDKNGSPPIKFKVDKNSGIIF